MEFIISTHIFVLTLSIQFKIPHERIRAGAGVLISNFEVGLVVPIPRFPETRSFEPCTLTPSEKSPAIYC